MFQIDAIFQPRQCRQFIVREIQPGKVSTEEELPRTRAGEIEPGHDHFLQRIHLGHEHAALAVIPGNVHSVKRRCVNTVDPVGRHIEDLQDERNVIDGG